MKRNLRKLLLTRVYNGRSTTIFCVTSVTRRLLDTTTRCYAYGRPCAYVTKFYAYDRPLCPRPAVCIDTPMLCIRPHSTQFPLVSLSEAFLHFIYSVSERPGFRVWQNERVSPGPGFSKTRAAIPTMYVTQCKTGKLKM